MKEKHLNRLNAVISRQHDVVEKCSLFISVEDEYYVDQTVEKEIGGRSRYVVVAPGAADQSKRWPVDLFASVCDWLISDRKVTIVFVGNFDDQDVVAQIKTNMVHTAVDLSGRLNLTQLAALLKTSSGAIVNDSAPMHLASYLDIPVLALFGPSDPSLYGPWGSRSSFIRKNENCAKCAKPKKQITHTCMQSITVEDVIQALKTNASDGKIHFENESRI
jgi:ADP-heptose:LPS heptosyltransferase